MVNLPESFTDILKWYILQRVLAKFAKCILWRTTLSRDISIDPAKFHFIGDLRFKEKIHNPSCTQNQVVYDFKSFCNIACITPLVSAICLWNLMTWNDSDKCALFFSLCLSQVIPHRTGKIMYPIRSSLVSM